MTATSTIGNILIVDDEEHIIELLKYNLESERYAVQTVTKAAAVVGLNLSDVNLVITDAMSQPYNGMDLLHDLKSNPLTAYIPVIILSHDNSESAIIGALDDGADDYIVKPFSLRELVARIRSVFRRHPAGASPRRASAVLTFRTVSVDLATRQVTDDGTPIPLTKTEFAILALLVKNKGRFFTRMAVFDEVWRNEGRPSSDRIVDTNISRLRKKLGASADALVNRTGQGYAIID